MVTTSIINSETGNLDLVVPSPVQKLNLLDDVSIHLKTLSDKLFSDLKKQIFDEHITRIIELTRVVTDVASLSNDVKEYGHVTVGLQRSKDFIKAARKLTSTPRYPR